jgi:Domain of unknown function (DUF4136)
MLIKHCKWVTLLFVAILGGCYPEGAEYFEELDLVYTNYSEDYDFQSKKTYSVPDSVIKITGERFEDGDTNGKPEFVSPTYSTVMISELKKNMESYGWTLVDKGNNPDVILLVSAMTTTNIYYYYDWAYWGWYYPGYYPGWGWYYPGSYYPTYVTGYRSGSVFVQMVDAQPRIQGENIPVVWSSIINGLAEGGTENINSRIQTGIGKAFSQSPYLKK